MPLRHHTHLVGRVADHRRFPLSTARDGLTSRVGDHVRYPIAILLVIPLFGLFSLGVGDDLGLVDQPVFGDRSGLVDNRGRGGLIPVVGLGGW